MKGTSIAALAIILLVGVAYFSSGRGGGNGAGPITQAWVNQQLIAWKPAQNSSIGWSAQFSSASYDNILQTNASTVQSNLLMLLSSGASCIRIDIGYDAFLKNNLAIQLELASLITQIRLAGKCLIIADASAEYYRNNPLSWSAFQSAWIQRVSNLAGLFHPNFYIVVKEPAWYAPMITNAISSVSQLDNITNYLAQAVLSASPNTKVGVTTPGNSLANSPFNQWFVDSSKSNLISFLGVDNYAIGDYIQTVSASQYGTNGKSLWIAEAGDSVTYPSVSSSQSQLDVSWMQMLYYFGLYVHATNLIPFWTSPPDFQTGTPFYNEFQILASTYGGTVS